MQLNLFDEQIEASLIFKSDYDNAINNVDFIQSDSCIENDIIKICGSINNYNKYIDSLFIFIRDILKLPYAYLGTLNNPMQGLNSNNLWIFVIKNKLLSRKKIYCYNMIPQSLINLSTINVDN